MTSKEFTIWLKGFLDASDTLTEEGIQFLQDKLKEVQDDYIPSPGDWISPWNTTPIQPYVIDYNIVCPMGGAHEYPNFWHSILPPPCKKCGATLPGYTVSYENNGNSIKTTTIIPGTGIGVVDTCCSTAADFSKFKGEGMNILKPTGNQWPTQEVAIPVEGIPGCDGIIMQVPTKPIPDLVVNIDPVPFQYKDPEKYKYEYPHEAIKKDIELQFENLRQANDINKDAPKLEAKTEKLLYGENLPNWNQAKDKAIHDVKYPPEGAVKINPRIPDLEQIDRIVTDISKIQPDLS